MYILSIYFHFHVFLGSYNRGYLCWDNSGQVGSKELTGNPSITIVHHTNNYCTIAQSWVLHWKRY